MTCISRKEVFDILDHFRQEQVTNENEDLLIRMLAKELLQLKTYEIEEKEEVKKMVRKSFVFFTSIFALFTAIYALYLAIDAHKMKKLKEYARSLNEDK